MSIGRTHGSRVWHISTTDGFAACQENSLYLGAINGADAPKTPTCKRCLKLEKDALRVLCIGKSALVKEMAEKAGLECVDIKMPKGPPYPDYSGIPYVKKENNNG